MSAMQTRSVRVDAGALDRRAHARTQRRHLLRLVRDVVDYVARTGKMPRLEGRALRLRTSACSRSSGVRTSSPLARGQTRRMRPRLPELLSAALEDAMAKGEKNVIVRPTLDHKRGSRRARRAPARPSRHQRPSDYLDARRAEHDTARRLVHALISGTAAPAAPASSYKDVYYILRRSLGSEPDARGALARPHRCVPIAPVDLRGSDLAPSIVSDEPDFEDALVRRLAEREGLVAIVTRDASAFRGSHVPVFDPREFLALLGRMRDEPVPTPACSRMPYRTESSRPTAQAVPAGMLGASAPARWLRPRPPRAQLGFRDVANCFASASDWAGAPGPRPARATMETRGKRTARLQEGHSTWQSTSS